MRLFQLNLQNRLGGAEVFAGFCCRAFERLGLVSEMFVSPKAKYWHQLDMGAHTKLIPTTDPELILKRLTAQRSWLLTHTPLPRNISKGIPDVLVSGFAHMPPQGRDAQKGYGRYELIFPVSNWVLQGLLESNLPAWHLPLYGVADLSGRQIDRQSANVIQRAGRYDWDQRKYRDQLLGLVEPLIENMRAHPPFIRRDGLTLGIVSRLTPIKQFPLMFAQLAPVLARYPRVNLEIFGSGGYASVRDLDAALRPCASQVRFWGQQGNVAGIYRQLDYLLSGLPEKEALGLNIIEAQACGTPVIAVDAPPFTETVLDGKTGFLYRDPRQDAGADFGRLLDELLAGRPRPRPELAPEHLARFSFDAFVERLKPVVAEVQARINSA